MTSYVALIRGIMPMNPNMRNDKLRGVFEKLGFKDVGTVISSGNVIFKSSAKSISGLETKIEKALMKNLGFNTIVIVRSKDELEKIMNKNPFEGKEHSRKSYLVVTFLKKEPRELFAILDVTKASTPDFMKNLEKNYGKVITTRTWKTIGRIVQRL